MRFALVLAVLLAATNPAHALTGTGIGAAGLQKKYLDLKAELASNAFGRPLHLDSLEGQDNLAGDVYAVVDRPFASAAPALVRPESWCDILLLVLNIKQCRVAGTILNVNIGRKYDEPIERTHLVAFSYGVESNSKDYMQVRLSAKEGPLSTRDYLISLEAIPLGDAQTFIRLSYTYGYGTAGRLAMKTYLGTLGSGKVGFTVEGKASDGTPNYIGGMRGVIERNTMRYYLAIDSFLGALDRPRPQRIEKSARDWFAATERYARQLHEMSEREYLDMKKKEYARQARANERSGEPKSEIQLQDGKEG